MVPLSVDDYEVRCAFQNDLDDAFPHGAVCAVLPMVDGHVRPAEWVENTGRVFCSGARRLDHDGEWLHELLIDTRSSVDHPRREMRVWVSRLHPHESLHGLWEATIVGEGETKILRLNADPPVDGPTASMRRAVTKVHEVELFPRGLAQ